MKYIVIILALALCSSIGESGSSDKSSSTKSEKSSKTKSSNKGNRNIKKCMKECEKNCAECLFNINLSSPTCLSCVDGFVLDEGSCVVDECFSNPCQNGGTCTDAVNAYTCDCADGYTDHDCSTNIDECSPNPCENGGTCDDGINEYTCNCADGYTDPNCSTNIDDCSPNPCQNAGTCTDGVDAYTCDCADGYTDPECGTDIDECSPNPCQNGGTCTDGVNGYSCACVKYYTDPECSTDLCPSSSLPTCTVTSDGTITGYDGSTDALPDTDGLFLVTEYIGTGSGTDPCNFEVKITTETSGDIKSVSVKVGDRLNSNAFPNWFTFNKPSGQVFERPAGVPGRNILLPHYWNNTETFIEITLNNTCDVWTLRETGDCDYTFQVVPGGIDKEPKFTAEIGTPLVLDGPCGPYSSS